MQTPHHGNGSAINPYHFFVNDILVTLEFTDDAPPLQEVFTDLLLRKKSGL